MVWIPMNYWLINLLSNCSQKHYKCITKLVSSYIFSVFNGTDLKEFPKMVWPKFGVRLRSLYRRETNLSPLIAIILEKSGKLSSQLHLLCLLKFVISDSLYHHTTKVAPAPKVSGRTIVLRCLYVYTICFSTRIWLRTRYSTLIKHFILEIMYHKRSLFCIKIS